MEDYDATYECLTLERVLEKPAWPLFQSFGRNTEYWTDWGRSGRWYCMPTVYNKHNLKDICYYNDKGERHRIYGPAYINQLMDIEAWYKNGNLHNEHGWAYRHRNNFIWFFEGELHNLNGPAVIEQAGPKQYWIHGEKFSPKQYKWEVNRRCRKNIKK